MSGTNTSPRVRQTASEVHNILSRVSSLETGVDSLTNDVRSLARSLEGFASETRTAIQNLSAKMAEGNKTNWSTLASWAAVVISIIGLGMSGFIRDILRLENSYQQLRADYISHIKDGHPRIEDDYIQALTARVSALERRKGTSE